MSAKDLLDTISVESPCEVSWDSMMGNDQVRFCEHCNLTVKDLSQLTRKRALRLVRASKGRLCIRYQSRPDGSFVTRSTPQKLYRIGRRASRIAAGAFSATLGLSSAASAQSCPPSPTFGFQPSGRVESTFRPMYFSASISGTINDPNGEAIPGATVTISNPAANLIRVNISNDLGMYQFQGLEAGTYKLTIEASGFATSVISEIVLQAGTQQQANATLEVAGTSVTVGMVMMPDPSEPLVKAASDDDLPAVEQLVTRKNVNLRDQASGLTALECAVRNGNREMVQALLRAGADVNARDESKQTVLMQLGEETTSEILWDLINAGAKVNLKSEAGFTALMGLAMTNNSCVLNALLQVGARVDDKNDAGETALMLAASAGFAKNVRALIAAGADINARNKENKTALNYAKDYDQTRVAKLLISYGASDLIQAEPK
jgi:Carboxypeptidase regulatory-like domain/Ankyrin repeats (3 copies)